MKAGLDVVCDETDSNRHFIVPLLSAHIFLSAKGEPTIFQHNVPLLKAEAGCLEAINPEVLKSILLPWQLTRKTRGNHYVSLETHHIYLQITLGTNENVPSR